MLKVLKSGFFTTVQDAGRYGYRNKGVPVSGAMDAVSAGMVNQLLENEVHDALLEITMTGPTLQFEKPTYICLGGAELSPTLNNVPIKNFEVIKITSGDILSYGRLTGGFRGYLGIKEGFKTKKVLGSRAFFSAVTDTVKLHDFDTIDYVENTTFTPKLPSLKQNNHLEKDTLEVHLGPDFELFDEAMLQKLFKRAFTVSKMNNRMAYQLEERLLGHSMSMLTSTTMPGTVQLTPAGTMIVLMRDGQTTGGYPRILQLTEEAICLLAQKKTGDMVRFKKSRL